MNPKIKAWIEAMRLRTLPAGVSGVIAGTACALYHEGFAWPQAVICLFFAVGAQIVANFANEYYDFKNGLDKKGREGFRRGVTEGDIEPGKMKLATYLTLLITCLLGCSLIIWGGWWLVFVGLGVGVFALAYSAGPYPLSHHGLGDIAVIGFFGIIPVIFTQYVESEHLFHDSVTWFVAIATGLMAANILIVNNYRDFEDDKKVGKHTTVVIFGKRAMLAVYLFNGIISAILLAMASSRAPFWVCAGWLSYLWLHFCVWNKMKNSIGKELNPILKQTSLLLLGVTSYLLIIFAIFTESYDNDGNLPFFLMQ